MEQIVTTKNAEETIKVASEFAQKLNPQDVVFLRGDLGSGKTTFTQGIAKGLGIESRIISPTFVVVRTHEIKSQKIKTLYHMDLYRLNDENDVKRIDIKDYLEDKNGVVVIEWPEIGQNLVDKKVWNINIEPIDSEGRKIKISYD